MTARTLRLTSALAALTLAGTLALAQQPTATVTAAAPTADTSAPAAPIERQAPSDQAAPSEHRHMHPNGMRPIAPGQEDRPNLRARFEDRGDLRQNPDNFRAHSFHRMNADFHPGAHNEWWKNPMLAQRLALTPEQTTRLDAISQQSRLHLIDLRANLERQQALLEPLLRANPIDTTRALAQVDKLAEARAALEESQAKMMLTLRAVLTPDQWTKLSDRRGPNRFGPNSSDAPDDTPNHP